MILLEEMSSKIKVDGREIEEKQDLRVPKRGKRERTPATYLLICAMAHVLFRGLRRLKAWPVLN